MQKLCLAIGVFCASLVHAQSTININRPYTNNANQNVNVQNINGSGSIKNYGTMKFSNFGINADTIYNYGTMNIGNANSGVIVNMGTVTFDADNFNGSLILLNQSNGSVTFTKQNVYINNYICNSGNMSFKNFTLNGQGKFYNCGTSTGSIFNPNNAGLYTETSCGSCQYISPLPVVLNYFKANRIAQSTELIWQTSSEVNADYFEVLKSKDFENWESVARVPAAGNSNQVLNYSLSIAKERELYYYNLKQVDYNGTINDHGIISIKPEFNNFTLKNNSVQVIEPSSIRLYNTMGVMVKSAENCTDFSWDEIPGGIYIVTINGESLKVVKTN